MRPLRAIAGRHEVLGIEILDPRDIELPPVGDVILQDAESGVTRVHRRRAAAGRLREGRGRAPRRGGADLRRCDAPLLSLRTDRDWIADVVRFVANRRRGALAGRWQRLREQHRRPSQNEMTTGMTLPLLGPVTLTGFEHVWFLLFLFVVLGVVALYIVVQLARHKQMLRFANMELLESVAPKRPVALAASAGDPAGGVAASCSPSRWPGLNDVRIP